MKLLRFFAAFATVLALGGDLHAEFIPVSVTPSDGSKVEELSVIKTVWDCEWFDKVNSEKCGQVTDSDGNMVSSIDCEADFLDPFCDFMLSEPVTAPGVYKVTIFSETLLSDEDEWNEEFTLTYTVGDVVAGNPLELVRVYPAEGAVLSSLDTLTLYWSAAVESVDADLVVPVYDSDDEMVAELKVSLDDVSEEAIVLTASPALDVNGKYMVRIPEGIAVGADGAKSESVELTYTIDTNTYLDAVRGSSSVSTFGRVVRNNSGNTVRVLDISGSWVAELEADGQAELSPGVYLITGPEAGMMKVMIP